MVDVFYTKFNDHLPEKNWSIYLNTIPEDMKLRALKYNRWQDQHHYVLGKLLLLESLFKYGYDKNVLSKIRLTKYGKPFLNEAINFSVSHSSGYVICATGKNLNVGVDIELIQGLDFEDFTAAMTPKQWNHIVNSSNPLKSFYQLWTIKESVMKGDGRGMSIPILDIKVDGDLASYHDKIWYLKEIYIDDSTVTSLATNVSNIALNFTEINFTSGIKSVQRILESNGHLRL